uniref:Mitochondrial carrier protein n=1 Tax=Chromera velia CCMP2878 TaxID=1169474 RepID=A0A0G4HM95_9ALVE|eukprot:Cvel_1167.t1-p1 / transcript=Cvel_1167.t1 / gene=Cvel_1167 / organism=Chromera_velia_CCMP2878 / gene_product=Mitochondrial substrate carrier family protein E, putative / transcript_product=Mitochondrial substrate carrier family protein E, putative / location=Cvel_scaffold38:163327-168070(-) / protein_length=358 / sequence_SO=supercontig / SO=protein_coding / is_pseudo=false
MEGLLKPEEWKELRGTMFGGAAAGMVSKVLTHPIDTCKAKLQVQKKGKTGIGAPVGAYKNSFDAFKATWSRSGFRGLYAGFAIAGIGSVPAQCLYFTSYEFFRKVILSRTGGGEKEKEGSFAVDFVSGFLAEAVSCVLWVPIDVSKEQLQTQAELKVTNHTGSFNAIRNIIRHDGLLKIYRGYYATLLSFGPFSAFYFMFYEQFKTLLLQLRGRRPRLSNEQNQGGADSSCENERKVGTSCAEQAAEVAGSSRSLLFGEALVVGTCAGAAASFITTPLDLVKLRLQVQRSAARSASGRQTPFLYNSFWQGMKELLGQEGLLGSFRGAGARMLVFAPSSAIGIATMETLKSWYVRKFEA